MTLRIHYHRDFDGMASAAMLAEALIDTGRETEIDWLGLNFDKTLDWEDFSLNMRFAVVDFHYHPRASYWFDHHPTTFLDENHQEAYADSETMRFDPESPSCPPIIAAHSADHWGWEMPERFADLIHWSNIIDSAGFESAEQALFGFEPAIRISRALTCSPDYSFHDRMVGWMRNLSLEKIADNPQVDKCFSRSCSNRDNALENFTPNIRRQNERALMADLRSKKIRRDRFAPFYLYPDIQYSITVLPTRAGVHITIASNPWNRPTGGPHLGELMKKYGGGGHLGVGGCNPPDEETAMAWAKNLYELVATP